MTSRAYRPPATDDRRTADGTGPVGRAEWRAAPGHGGLTRHPSVALAVVAVPSPATSGSRPSSGRPRRTPVTGTWRTEASHPVSEGDEQILAGPSVSGLVGS